MQAQLALADPAFAKLQQEPGAHVREPVLRCRFNRELIKGDKDRPYGRSVVDPRLRYIVSINHQSFSGNDHIASLSMPKLSNDPSRPPRQTLPQSLRLVGR